MVFIMREDEVGCTFTFPKNRYWRFKTATSMQKMKIKECVTDMIDSFIHEFEKLCEESNVEHLSEKKEPTIEFNEFIRRNALDGI